MSKRMTIIGLTTCAVLLAFSSAVQAHPSRCSSCHLPHGAVAPGVSGTSYGVPLWNPLNVADVTTVFTVYTSPTFDNLATGIGQPDGPSKMCLGCHDGTYSHNANHTFGDAAAMTLTGSHPISFVYDTALAGSSLLHVPGALKDPATTSSGVSPLGTIATDLLDSQGKLQCTSCHDIHSSNTRADTAIGTWSGKTLRFNYPADLGKAMCRTCHKK